MRQPSRRGWLGWLERSQRCRRRAPPVRFRPAVDPMEDRTLLSTLTVKNANDSGPGSLRAAVNTANQVSGDSILFDSSLAGKTIKLTGGELVIKRSMTIDGTVNGAFPIISGGGTSRVFHITKPVAVTLAGLEVTGGKAALGGGILNEGGALTLERDLVAYNLAIGAKPGDPGRGAGWPRRAPGRR